MFEPSYSSLNVSQLIGVKYETRSGRKRSMQNNSICHVGAYVLGAGRIQTGLLTILCSPAMSH